MTIKFSKKQTDNSIQLTANCTIQNWDPKKETNKNNQIFNFNAYSDNKLNGIGNVQEKLLWALAGGHNCNTCNDPDNLVTLTELDLKEAAQNINNKKNKKFLGDVQIKEFRYDEHYGIVNITTAKGDVLRLDLLTKAEKQNREDSSKGIFKKIKTTIVKTIEKVKQQTQVKLAKNTKSLTKKSKGPNPRVYSGNYKSFIKELGFVESSENINASNKLGYKGQWQLGTEALMDAGYIEKDEKAKKNNWNAVRFTKYAKKKGITTVTKYQNSSAAQYDALIKYKQQQWIQLQALIKRNHLENVKVKNGIKITPAALLAGAHLRGPGAVINFLQGKGDAIDANNIPVSHYMRCFQNFNLKGLI